MPTLGRKTLKSAGARNRRIDIVFGYIGYTLILLYFFFVISIWLSCRDAFRIDGIQIRGASAVDKDAIARIANNALSKKLLWRIDRNNVFLYPWGQIVKETYLLDGRVKSVDTEVVGRKHLVVSVEEYTPKLLACPNMVATTSVSGADCYFGDDSGYIFARSPEYSGYFFPIFITHDVSLGSGNIIGTHVLPREEFFAIQSFLDALRAAGFTTKKIEYIGEHDYEIVTEKPWGIRWSSSASSTQSVDNLGLVLRSIEQESADMNELKMVDLRFGNKIFYR